MFWKRKRNAFLFVLPTIEITSQHRNWCRGNRAQTIEFLLFDTWDEGTNNAHFFFFFFFSASLTTLETFKSRSSDRFLFIWRGSFMSVLTTHFRRKRKRFELTFEERRAKKMSKTHRWGGEIFLFSSLLFSTQVDSIERFDKVSFSFRSLWIRPTVFSLLHGKQRRSRFTVPNDGNESFV